MNSGYRRHGLIPGLVLLWVICLAASVCAHQEKTEEKTFTVNPGGTLLVNTDLGSIEITSAAGNTVHAEVLIKMSTHSEEKAKELLEDFDLSFEQNGNDVEINGDYHQPRGLHGFLGFGDSRLEAIFRITVPEKYNLDIETAGGDILIGNLEGTVQLRTAGGDIHMEHIRGTLQVETAGGDLTLIECTAEADLQTSGGDIEVDRAGGPVVAHTSGGDITIREAMNSIDASTSGGDVKAYIARQPEDDCSLETSGGDVDIYLAPDISVTVDADADVGSVSSDFDLGRRSRHHDSTLRGDINKGGPRLFVRTSAGDISILEK